MGLAIAAKLQCLPRAGLAPLAMHVPFLHHPFHTLCHATTTGGGLAAAAVLGPQPHRLQLHQVGGWGRRLVGRLVRSSTADGPRVHGAISSGPLDPLQPCRSTWLYPVGHTTMPMAILERINHHRYEELDRFELKRNRAIKVTRQLLQAIKSRSMAGAAVDMNAEMQVRGWGGGSGMAVQAVPELLGPWSALHRSKRRAQAELNLGNGACTNRVLGLHGLQRARQE